MYLVSWRYVVPSDRVQAFERVYSSEGEWASFFRGSPAYRGSVLLPQSGGTGAYLLIDAWADRESYERFLRDHAVEYAERSAASAGLYAAETKLGAWEAGSTPF